MASRKSVLITGCSKGGLGNALAKAFHNTGYRVFATARNPSKMTHFADLDIETIVLDVESNDSITAAVSEVSKRTQGTLDVLVNNSGIAYMMPIADVDLSRAQKIFNVNVMSNIAMIQAFLPLLRKAAPGSMIVNNSSIASVVSFPLQGIYSATKAAFSAINDAARVELEPFGIRVVELKTGSVSSKFFENHAKGGQDGKGAKLREHSSYDLVRDILEERMNGSEIMKGAADPDQWAKEVVNDLTKANPPAQIWKGAHSWMIWIMRTFFPHTAPDRPAKRMSGMDVLADRLRNHKEVEQSDQQ